MKFGKNVQNSVLVLPAPGCLVFLISCKASILSITSLPYEVAWVKPKKRAESNKYEFSRILHTPGWGISPAQWGLSVLTSHQGHDERGFQLKEGRVQEDDTQSRIGKVGKRCVKVKG